MLRWLLTDGEVTIAVNWRDDGRSAVGGYTKYRNIVEHVAEVVLGEERVGPQYTQRNKLRYTAVRSGKDVAQRIEELVAAGWTATVARSTGRVMR